MIWKWIQARSRSGYNTDSASALLPLAGVVSEQSSNPRGLFAPPATGASQVRPSAVDSPGPDEPFLLLTYTMAASNSMRVRAPQFYQVAAWPVVPHAASSSHLTAVRATYRCLGQRMRLESRHQ